MIFFAHRVISGYALTDISVLVDGVWYGARCPGHISQGAAEAYAAGVRHRHGGKA